jgi:nucleoside-diphosphate-sugar epimerase
MLDALVFGGSGQVGAPLLERLRDAGWRVFAVSRGRHADLPGVQWLQGDLACCDGLPRTVDAIISCGPLDHFARWYAASAIEAPRVLAFGSTSVEAKRDSADPHERDLAQRLREGERRVFDAAVARHAQATLLRPTLVYGAGRDLTLTRIAGLARQWGRFVLPSDARGLRQPVHVDDLAAAALAALAAGTAQDRAYDLPGGETLPYREMVARTLAALQPPPRLLEVPPSLVAAALMGARALGRGAGFGAAALARMREDLVFDAAAAQNDFGYAPRPFRPTAAMFDDAGR